MSVYLVWRVTLFWLNSTTLRHYVKNAWLLAGGDLLLAATDAAANDDAAARSAASDESRRGSAWPPDSAAEPRPAWAHLQHTYRRARQPRLWHSIDVTRCTTDISVMMSVYCHLCQYSPSFQQHWVNWSLILLGLALLSPECLCIFSLCIE